jgi:predicted ribosomally synthesized peptide with nif11-like leader
MSITSIEQFVEKANQDKSIQDNIKTFTGIPDESYRKMINLAKEYGYEFTTQEWKDYPKSTAPGTSPHGFTEWSSEILVPWLK